jgi:hypothetical protein
MRGPRGLLVAALLLGCEGPVETNLLRLPPPTPTFSATTRVLPVAGNAPALEVSASLQNATTTHFIVAQCPLVIGVSPYPPGSYGGASDECPPGSPTRELAPGDTATMTRVLGADTLASFAPGQYRVSVNVTFHEITQTTGNTIMGGSAGIVQLPLDTTSH